MIDQQCVDGSVEFVVIYGVRQFLHYTLLMFNSKRVEELLAGGETRELDVEEP